MQHALILGSPDLLRGATLEQRAAATQQIALALGQSWAAGAPSMGEDALSLEHRPTGLAFVLVPGGTFSMGLSEDDIEQISEFVDFSTAVERHVERMAAKARPVHPVSVRPFLCSRALVSEKDLVRLAGPIAARRGAASGALSRDDAKAFAASLHLRLCSEAELEWLARDGGTAASTLHAADRYEETGGDEDLLRSRFGTHDLAPATWAADDWHPTYASAPTDSAPWTGGSPKGVYRGGFSLASMQSNEELIVTFAAARNPGPGLAFVRLAADLPWS